ncbi:NAD(P)-binding protein [Violaceomyces palustris]|uniref:NAD(P)-binding protein n=1 Tax=Violaceomyces palustris TaxID=1673888 RepID=A0ACD0NQW2_9BASI|nr:NAD(P)-binding protein [Violaceomyces palustris]
MTPNQAAEQRFKEPFTFDKCARILDKVPFSTPFLLILPLLTYLYDRKATSPTELVASLKHLSDLPRSEALALVKGLIFTQYKWVGYSVSFILIKTVNRILNRYIRNHGEWRRDPLDYSKDVVVITGGSQGIGAEIVKLLSKEKRATIAVLDFSLPTYPLKQLGGGRPDILHFKVDVSNPEMVKEAGAKIRESTRGKRIGCLINCAGIASGDTILDVDLSVATKVWKVNTLANWVTCQEFLPDLIRNNHGHVITVSSSGAYASLPSMSEYSTSKAGALAFHECLAIELRTRYNARRVRTTVVCPTKVRTAMGDGMEDHLDPFLTPVLEPIQVAQKVVWSLDSGLSQHLLIPLFANILPYLRVLPDHFRRLVAVLGNTDNQVTKKSMRRALNNGYGKGWEGENKEIYERKKKILLAGDL